MRPLWRGAVSFGLVYVPVKLYVATERKNIKFDYLHEKCKTSIQYQRICPNCQVEVPMDEIVRGYEYEKGRYVIMREEDFEQVPAGGSKRNIEILDFVEREEIDPIYYEKAYYLTPDEGGTKVYELLRQTMEETGKVAVARALIRSRETLAALWVRDNSLIMSIMFYSDELRQVSALPEMNYQVTLQENEIKMAESLISNLSSKFDPAKYTNTYRMGLMEVIQAKIAGREVEEVAKPEAGKVVDLMTALKASIDQAKKERGKLKSKRDVEKASAS